MSRSSLDSTSTNLTMSSSTNSTNYGTSTPSTVANVTPSNSTDMSDPGIGGVPNRYLGITSTYLWQTQLHQVSLSGGCWTLITLLILPTVKCSFTYSLLCSTLVAIVGYGRISDVTLPWDWGSFESKMWSIGRCFCNGRCWWVSDSFLEIFFFTLTYVIHKEAVEYQGGLCMILFH